MTEERHLEKCVGNLRKDKNAARKYLSGAKLKRFMTQR